MASRTSSFTNNVEESDHKQQQQISSSFGLTTPQKYPQMNTEGSSNTQTNGNPLQTHQSYNEFDIPNALFDSYSALYDFLSHEDLQQQMVSNNMPSQQINTPSNNDMLFTAPVQPPIENMLTEDQTHIYNDEFLSRSQYESINVPAGQEEQQLNEQLPLTSGCTPVTNFYVTETNDQNTIQKLPQQLGPDDLDLALECFRNLIDNNYVDNNEQTNDKHEAQELPNVNVTNRRPRTIRNRRPSTMGSVPAETITLPNGRIKCIPCNKDFTNNAYAKQHNRRHHSGDLSHYCDHCGKGFSQKEQMEAHKTTHDIANKAFKCQYCDKRYARKSDMQHHIKFKHDGSNKFACNVCGKRFERNANLLRHKRTHDKNDKVSKETSSKQ